MVRLPSHDKVFDENSDYGAPLRSARDQQDGPVGWLRHRRRRVPKQQRGPRPGAGAHDDQIVLTDSQLLQGGLFGVGVRAGRSSQGHAESVAKSAALRWIASFVVPLPPELVLKLGAMPCRRDGRPLLAANNTVIEPRLARQGQGDLGTSRTTSARILTDEIDSIVPRNSEVISRCSGWAASFSATPRRARSRGHRVRRCWGATRRAQCCAIASIIAFCSRPGGSSRAAAEATAPSISKA
jgi:hypothetical protein